MLEGGDFGSGQPGGMSECQCGRGDFRLPPAGVEQSWRCLVTMIFLRWPPNFPGTNTVDDLPAAAGRRPPEAPERISLNRPARFRMWLRPRAHPFPSRRDCARQAESPGGRMSGGRFHRQAFMLFAAALASTSVLAERCPPVEIRIEPGYEAPRGYEYAPQKALRARFTTKEAVLGLIETESGWDVAVGFTQRCLGEVCRVCVDRIEGKAGFGPGRQRLDEGLRGDRCRTDAVLERTKPGTRACSRRARGAE